MRQRPKKLLDQVPDAIGVRVLYLITGVCTIVGFGSTLFMPSVRYLEAGAACRASSASRQ